MISAFGLAVELMLPVPELDAVAPVPEQALPSGPALRVEPADAAVLEAAWSGSRTPPAVGRAVVDGSAWSAERGRDGDILMAHRLARFHLDPGSTTLLCAPSDGQAPAWRRLLLDTALVTASLARGRDALHAACVARGGGAIAVAGTSGAGKTTLLLELLRAGAGFLADDVVALEAGDEAVMAMPGPPVANFPASQPVGQLGERLHQLQDEWWVRISDPETAPHPLRTVLVLEPVQDADDSPPITRLEDKAAPLLQHALHSGSTHQRLEQRFALLARLAASTEVIRVRIDRSRPAQELVDRLIEAVPLLQA